MCKSEKGQNNQEAYRIQQHRSSAAAMVKTILKIQYFGPCCAEEPFVLQ